MSLRNRQSAPRPGMVWSERYRTWVEPDSRTPARRASDEKIARALERDQRRIRRTLRAAEKARGTHTAAIEGAARKVGDRLLQELIAARKDAGLSQAEVARRMGAPQSAVVRLEAGAHSPTLTTVSRYAAAIGVQLDVRRTA